jgi:transcriptional regulator with XRE-family HTH domain
MTETLEPAAIGRRLAAAREALGLSPAELAAKLGLSTKGLQGGIPFSSRCGS